MNIPYLLMDDYQLLLQYRINKKPVSSSSEKRWSAFWTLFRAHFVQLLPVLIFSYPLLNFFGFHSSLPLPSWKLFFFQFVVFNFLEDTGFYWIHRWLHTPYAYNKFHKLHHEYSDPFSLVGELAHPVEFVLNFLLPLMIGPFLLGYFQGVHIVTFWVWITFRGMRGSDAHSGYNLPFHPLRLLSSIYGGPLMHDFHHQIYGRSSNYGGYKLWDFIMGTDRKYHEYMQNKNFASNKTSPKDTSESIAK